MTILGQARPGQARPGQAKRAEERECYLRRAIHEPLSSHEPERQFRLGAFEPAEFFVHRHIYDKWTCRCCQRQGIERLLQEPSDPQIIDGGTPASGLVAHTLISRFVDHG